MTALATRGGPAAGFAADPGSPAASLLLAAGEVSGDLVAARLADELTGRRPELTLWGLGGDRMAAAGVDLVARTTQLGAVGVSEPLAGVPDLWRAFAALRARVRRAPPAAAVVIGNDVFHAIVARWLRRQGVPVAALFPPQVWLWRALLPLFAGSYDRVLACFPEEQTLYARHVASELVGHYLSDLLAPVGDATRCRLRAALGLPAEAPVLAVLPGSRAHEVAAMLPVFAAAAGRLTARLRSDGAVLHVLVPVAEPSLAAAITAVLSEAGALVHPVDESPGRRPAGAAGGAASALEVRLIAGADDLPGTPVAGDRDPVLAGRTGVDRVSAGRLERVISPGQRVLAAADAALVASGTATLEAALLAVPMVIAYRVSPATLAVCRLCHRLGLLDGGPVGLPNLLLGERGWVEEPGRATPIPELGQDAVTPEAVAAAAWPLLTSPSARAAQRTLLARAVGALQPEGAAPGAAGAGVLARSAAVVLEMAGLGADPGAREPWEHRDSRREEVPVDSEALVPALATAGGRVGGRDDHDLATGAPALTSERAAYEVAAGLSAAGAAS